MGIDYRPAVRESTAELLAVERPPRGAAIADRVQRRRLLNPPACPSQRQVATVVGYPERQLRRWWRGDPQGGLAARRPRPRPGGGVERLEATARAVLEAEMTAGRVGRLRDAPRFLAERDGVHGHGVSGRSRRWQRHKIKLKPGRRRPR